MPAEPIERHVVTARAADIVATMASRELSGPVLVIADATTIAACAPAWASSFASAGIVHRVVVAGVDGVAAAAGLGTRAVVGAGSPAAIADASAAADALGVPLVVATHRTA